MSETPDTGGMGAQDTAADAAQARVAPDAVRPESTENSSADDRATDVAQATESPWADDRTTDLDPGRVASDDQQTPAERSKGEPDE